MAFYTMTLWDYLKSGRTLFDFDWYIWDESQRQRIVQMVCDYYMYREICADSPDYFHHLFNTRWKVLWPYYNNLYESAYIEFNPLTTHYTSEEITENVRGKSNENRAALGTNRSDTRNTDASTSHTTEATVANTQAVGTEHETTHRFVDFWERVDSHDVGTLDTNFNHTGHSETDGQVDKNGTTDATLDKQVNGTSDRHTTGTSTTDSTGNTIHSDYPQANIAAVSPQNPGKWATWAEDTKGKSTTTSEGDEILSTSETTGQQTHEDREDHETSHSQTDTSYQEVTDTDTTNTADKTTHATTDENITRDLETKNTTDHTETVNTDTKSFSNQTGKVDNTTQSAANSQMRTKTNRDMSRTTSGYVGKSPSALLSEYRRTLINIDAQLINAIGDLFMEVF